MKLATALEVLGSWKPFSSLPRSVLATLAEQLQALQLRPGQKLYDFDAPPPGVVLIASGTLRLLARDGRGAPFTLERLGPGCQAGVLPLLRGSWQTALAAAEPSRAWLLPSAAFLAVMEQEPDLQTAYAQPSLEELFGVAELSAEPRLPGPEALLKWASNQLAEHGEQHQVLLMPPGRHRLPEGPSPWLVSSTNVEDIPAGGELSGPAEIMVLGRLPARLVACPPAWPPEEVPQVLVVQGDASDADSQELEVLEPEWVDRASGGLAHAAQTEAFEDWYGRVGRDGSFPHLQGEGDLEEPLACLRMLARQFDLPFRKDLLRRVLRDQLKRQGSQGLGCHQLAALCDLIGLRPSLLQLRPDQLARMVPPALTLKQGHPRVIWSVQGPLALVSDPRVGQQWMPLVEIGSWSDDGTITVVPVACSAASPVSRFGLRWFLPALLQHRGILAQVLVASFFVQLFALLNPLLVQQIIDAVISQGNLSSLHVLGTLLVGLAIAQAVLGSLRTYLFSDTTNRIDITLGSVIIDHLLRLPLGYFAHRPVGEVSSRINELEKIRRFMTGTALTVVLDAVFSLIYIVVMLFYSVQLTIWALAVVPAFVGLTAVASPLIRQQLRDQAESNARVQSHLVETLGGIETLKGQGIELHSRWRWQQLYGGQMQAGFRNTVTSTAAGSASKFLEQLSGLLVLWVGATLVLKGELTLGQLIAFRILAGYVTNPMLRLATLWQQIQETSLSLERLADIVDQPEEIEIAGEQLPPLRPVAGHVRYEGVSFRFANHGAMQLRDVNLEIAAGSFVGIVGSSGSGKSTLLKLLTRLYNPAEGVIRIDGYDIAKVDLYSLRAQIGVVPQDSLLFDGTVLANVALGRPDASFEDVVEATEVACAHAFIQGLPAGYSSSVGERGAALSGGQRQRIAIARMVLKKPRLLILDEATSALDIDTERRLTQNLMEVYRGRTVLFITHRLGALRHADQILVMDQGALVEQGNHEALMALQGRYAAMYRQQEAALA
jgi:subfamily B ATP-binding cassette protein HlyB/CyaB